MTESVRSWISWLTVDEDAGPAARSCEEDEADGPREDFAWTSGGSSVPRSLSLSGVDDVRDRASTGGEGT